MVFGEEGYGAVEAFIPQNTSGATAAGLQLALNTLVPNRLDGIEWTLASQQLAPTIQPLASRDDSNFRDMVWVNRERTAVTGALLERPFTIPPGVSQVTFSALLALPIGGTGNPVQLQILDATGQTVLATVTAVPGTLVRVSTPYATVVPGTEYLARITFTSSGQADALLGDLRVTPRQDASSGIWRRNFVRIPVNPQTLRDNNEDSWSAVRYANQSAYAHVDFASVAKDIWVETYDNAGLYIPNNDAFAILVDGKFWEARIPATDKVDFTHISLPYGDRVSSLSVVAGAQVLASSFDVTNRGTFLCAVYVDAESIADLPLVESTQDKLVLYGDSKLAGFYSDLPVRDGIVPMLRSMGNIVINQAVGGGSLAGDTSATVISQAACVPFAQKLLRNNPTRIVLGIGRNDFTGATFTLANWTSQLGNLCDAVHALAPDVHINLLRFTHETVENPNGSGDTWTQWRDAMNTVASSRAFVDVMYGDGLWTVATAGNYTADGVHPNSRGYAMLASLIDTWTFAPGNPVFGPITAQAGEPYPWNPKELIGTGLRAWWSFDQGLVEGVMTALVASGTVPPAATITGVPAFDFSLILAVTVSGPLGTAKFKWSIDGGQSWVQTNVATAANVVLGTTGLTAHFPAGAYSNDNVYVASTKTASALDLSTNNNILGQANPANQFPLTTIPVPGRNPRQALLGNGTSTYLGRTMTLNSPYTIYIVGAMVDQASIRSFIGGSAGADDIFLYSNTPTTMALNAAGAQKQVTVDATVPHTYGCFVNAGTDINLRVDGVDNTAVSAGASNPTAFYIGGDVANNQWFVDGPIAECLIMTGIPSADIIVDIEAYFRNKYRTW